MRVLGFILLAGIVLSVLKAALAIVVVAFLAVLLFGVFYHPRETFGFLAFGVFSSVSQRHPIACVWLLSLMLITAMVIRQREVRGAALPRDDQPRLPPPSENHDPGGDDPQRSRTE